MDHLRGLESLLIPGSHRIVVFVVDDGEASCDEDENFAIYRVGARHFEQMTAQLRSALVEPSARPDVRALDTDPSPIHQLSSREQEVLSYITNGYTHGQTATRMRLRTTTVNTYVERIRRKLGAGNKADLTRIAMSLHYQDRDIS